MWEAYVLAGRRADGEALVFRLRQELSRFYRFRELLDAALRRSPVR